MGKGAWGRGNTKVQTRGGQTGSWQLMSWHWLREEGEGLCKVPRHWLTLQSLATASGWKGVFRAERYCKRNTNTCTAIHPHTNTTQAHMHIYVVTYIHTCIQKIRNTHSYRLAHIHTYIHTKTHTYTHTYTHTHTHKHTSKH